MINPIIYNEVESESRATYASLKSLQKAIIELDKRYKGILEIVVNLETKLMLLQRRIEK